MDLKFLFPHRYRWIGWVMALPSAVVMILNMYYEFGFSFLWYRGNVWSPDVLDAPFLFSLHTHNFTGEVAAILLILGLLMIAFSRERVEDERTMKLRLESLLWAVYVNTGLIMLAIVLTYGTMFLTVTVYNILSTLLIFIARYAWVKREAV
jgi:hypothetical protein